MFIKNSIHEDMKACTIWITINEINLSKCQCKYIGFVRQNEKKHFINDKNIDILLMWQSRVPRESERPSVPTWLKTLSYKTLPEHPRSHQHVSGVGVAQSFVFYGMLCHYCVSIIWQLYCLSCHYWLFNQFIDVQKTYLWISIFFLWNNTSLI